MRRDVMYFIYSRRAHSYWSGKNNLIGQDVTPILTHDKLYSRWFVKQSVAKKELARLESNLGNNENWQIVEEEIFDKEEDEEE